MTFTILPTPTPRFMASSEPSIMGGMETGLEPEELEPIFRSVTLPAFIMDGKFSTSATLSGSIPLNMAPETALYPEIITWVWIKGVAASTPSVFSILLITES